MASGLYSILEDSAADNNPGVLGKLKNLYKEKIDSIRPYIASMGGLSLGIANWSKDFAYTARVVVPFFNSFFYINGHYWYDIALGQEAITTGTMAATAKDKLKTGMYAIAYEAGSAVNTALYYLLHTGFGLDRYYGGIWNAVFYFYQIPMFFLMSRHYFGKGKDTKDLNGTKKE